MTGFLAWLAVALGGALGSLARYAGTLASARAWGVDYPWGTIAINIAGSFLIAFFGMWVAGKLSPNANHVLRLFVMTGFCGGFTTFSSFSLQTLELIQGGRWAGAAANVVLSVCLCLAAAALGYYCGVLAGSSR